MTKEPTLADSVTQKNCRASAVTVLGGSTTIWSMVTTPIPSVAPQELLPLREIVPPSGMPRPSTTTDPADSGPVPDTVSKCPGFQCTTSVWPVYVADIPLVVVE